MHSEHRTLGQVLDRVAGEEEIAMEQGAYESTVEGEEGEEEGQVLEPLHGDHLGDLGVEADALGRNVQVHLDADGLTAPAASGRGYFRAHGHNRERDIASETVLGDQTQGGQHSLLRA